MGLWPIRSHNLALTSLLIDSIDPPIVASPAYPGLRSGTVIIADGSDEAGLLHRLTEANFAVDQRADGIRISPHIYNTSDQVLALAEAIGPGLRSTGES